ncbi:morphogenetic protein [Serratia marcescens]|uniref:morphogenetic protein n=1 Tax=Serratia marcescens TaxID=615 RepID=UPI00287588B7|nr:morphogenetic protein [Serratia marcescens]MDS0779568.1 morphogenetic protein [Serratia marcescens]
MKERPVIFNGEMVRAIIDGRKTQTRRIAKADNSNHLLGCPFGQVGDRLWVRETFAAFDADWKHPGKPHDLRDGPWPNVVYPASVAKIPDGTCRPSIHMPRWASRILLEITAVRVERLNDISEEDAKAEGVRAIGNNFGNGPAYCDYLLPNLDDAAEWYNRARDSFKSLWKSIYGAESWSANPWVWVIEFKQVSAREVEREA